jgi:hypothetical protein
LCKSSLLMVRFALNKRGIRQLNCDVHGYAGSWMRPLTLTTSMANPRSPLHELEGLSTGIVE